MKVLIAIDGSESSQRVVNYLAEHRGMFCRADAVTCAFIEPPPPLRAVGAFGADPGMPAIAPIDADAIAAPLVQQLRGAGYLVELEVREGEPGPEIAQLAADGGYDLVILGARQRGLLRRSVLGSVANKVLTDSSVPVLIVR
jgi:nucleotide-binding universal stress UspA family protein